MGLMIGRRKELDDLAEYCQSGKAELVCVYGRRRVGKTYLMENAFGGEFAFSATGSEDKRGRTQLKVFHSALREFGCRERAVPASLSRIASVALIDVDAAYPHRAVYDGEGVCPAVKFVNGGDADSGPLGEVEPLIDSQRALNEVNFDRHIVSRFGAFPQKVITGWTAGPAEVLKASASRVWTFGDDRVRAAALPAASVEPYNSVLEEIVRHIAQVAQIAPTQIVGQMANLSAEALWAAEASQQRKLDAKRRAFGESWELALHLAVETESGSAAVPHGAEVVWRDTEAHSFGSIVDGVTKLAAQGVPIDLLMTLVPGMTQQQIKAIRDRLGVDPTPSALAALADPPLLADAEEEERSGLLPDPGAPDR